MNEKIDSQRPSIPLGHYRHYKGGEYDVLGVALHSESLEPLVVYRSVSNAADIWARPHDMFIEELEIDGVLQKRFTRIID